MYRSKKRDRVRGKSIHARFITSKGLGSTRKIATRMEGGTFEGDVVVVTSM